MPSPQQDDLIDRVDDADRVIGTVTRAEALATGAGFRTVHVLAIDPSGSILLQRIGSVDTRHPDRWGSSVAGYLHAGESPLAGARRRMAEEIGLTGPLEDLGVVHMRDESSSKFVHAYATVAAGAHLTERGHIAELRLWRVDEITLELKRDPDAFTPTFAKVFALLDPR